MYDFITSLFDILSNSNASSDFQILIFNIYLNVAYNIDTN